MPKLKRVCAGVYETHDGKYRVVRWDDNSPGYKNTNWAIKIKDQEGYDFVCEVMYLQDARDYIDGKNVFIIS